MWVITEVHTPNNAKVTINGGTINEVTTGLKTYPLGDTLDSEGAIYTVKIEGHGYIVLEDIGDASGSMISRGIKVNNDKVWLYKNDGHAVIHVDSNGDFTISDENHSVTGTLLGRQKKRSGTPIMSLKFKVKTASKGGSWFDGPGTDADIHVQIGDPNGRFPKWELNNWGNDFKAGWWDNYTLDPQGLFMEDLKKFTLLSSLPTIISFNDVWIIAEILIEANNQLVYINQDVNTSINSSAGSNNTWSDIISPFGIDPTRKYDECCFLCTHNAYANWQAGWFYEQQNQTISSQLNRGVRAFMLDTHAIDNRVVFLHENHRLSSLATLGTRLIVGWQTFSDYLKMFNTFLINNPKEVITLILESYVNSPDLMKAAVTEGQVLDRIFFANQDNHALDGSIWNVRHDGWPTLAWMAKNKKNLVILSSQFLINGLPYIWNYAVENHYGDRSLSIRTALQHRHESSPLNLTWRKLFIMNHFPTWSLSALSLPEELVFSGINNNYDGHNGYNDSRRIMRIVNEIKDKASRLPNFLAVDFFQIGAHGGPGQAVRRINKLWKDEAP